MQLKERPIPIQEARSRTPLNYVRPETVPDVSKTFYTKNGKAPNAMQQQVERQLAELGAAEEMGLSSLVGLGWTELYKDHGHKIGESTYEVISDVIVSDTAWDDRYWRNGPGLVMSSGHKMIRPRMRRNKKLPADVKSELRVLEYTYVDAGKDKPPEKIIRDIKSISREDLFIGLSGHYTGLVSSLWYKRPEADDSRPDPEILRPRLDYRYENDKGEEVPALYDQLVRFREALNIDETAADFVWEQGDLTMRASFLLAEAPISYAGSQAKIIVTVQTIKDGRVIKEDVYKDSSSKPTQRKKDISFKDFFNKFKDAAEKPTNARFEVRMTPEQKARREKTSGEKWLGGMATGETVKPGISTREAMDLMTYTPPGTPKKAGDAWKLRLRMRRKIPDEINELVDTVKDISKQIGKGGIVGMGTTLNEQYLEVRRLLKMPKSKDIKDDDYSWAIRDMARERKRADRKAKNPEFKDESTRRIADPIPNNAGSNIKRKEIVDYRIGTEFFDYIAPELKSWGKIIDEDTKDEAFIQHFTRDAKPFLLLHLPPSIRKQVGDLVDSAAAKKYGKGRPEQDYDAELAEMGRLLRLSVGR